MESNNFEPLKSIPQNVQEIFNVAYMMAVWGIGIGNDRQDDYVMNECMHIFLIITFLKFRLCQKLLDVHSLTFAIANK